MYRPEDITCIAEDAHIAPCYYSEWYGGGHEIVIMKAKRYGDFSAGDELFVHDVEYVGPDDLNHCTPSHRHLVLEDGDVPGHTYRIVRSTVYKIILGHHRVPYWDDGD